MAKATAEVLGDGKVIALGTVVDAAGYIVTKASLLQGKISCRLHDDGKEMEATLKGVSDDYDLALLKVEATDLTVAAWRTEPVCARNLGGGRGARRGRDWHWCDQRGTTCSARVATIDSAPWLAGDQSRRRGYRGRSDRRHGRQCGREGGSQAGRSSSEY